MKIDECHLGQIVRLSSSGKIYPIAGIRNGRIGLDRSTVNNPIGFMWVWPEAVRHVLPKEKK